MEREINLARRVVEKPINVLNKVKKNGTFGDTMFTGVTSGLGILDFVWNQNVFLEVAILSVILLKIESITKHKNKITQSV